MLSPSTENSDFERRFGGLRRLYGEQGAQRIFSGHAVVVGVGGVGSWAAEALARSGLGRITLIDMDHIAESNVNRQLHAVSDTLGQAKVWAMRERVLAINPACQVSVHDDFLTADNLSVLLEPCVADCAAVVVVDACDQVRTKTALAHWALQRSVCLVTVGAAGGKTQAQRVEVGLLSDVTHDPLLAQVRYRLRKHHAAPRDRAIPVHCVFSREPVSAPAGDCTVTDGGLNCHGYGSVVSVTATFGMVAAGFAINALAAQKK